MAKEIENKFPCPCGGRLRRKEEETIIDGINCGLLKVETCLRCGSKYFPDASMEIIERQLKEAGIWGMQKQEVSLWKSGKSVVVRIPLKIAKSLGLKPAMKGSIYKEDSKLVIEI